MKFNSLGSAAYGISIVNVDGAVPAPLVGLQDGQPSWQSDTQLIYQDCTSGVCRVDRLTYPALTIDTISPTWTTYTGGGGGVWAKFGSNSTNTNAGVYTSSGLSLNGAYLAWQARNGQTAVVDVYQSAGPMTVYDSSAAVLQQLNVTLVNNRNVRLQDNLLVYQDALGYHIIDVTDGSMPKWYPRTDGVSICVPVVFNGRTYVLEGSNMLTLRQIERSKGWILREGPFDYNPDIVAFGSTLRAGSCTDIGETVNSLTTYDISFTGENISVIVGTVSGGGIVYAAPVTISPSTFTVGAMEGSSLQPSTKLPVMQRIADPDRGFLINKSWEHAFQQLQTYGQRTAGVVQTWPPPVKQVAFDQVASSGQPNLLAQQGATTFTLSSADGTVDITLDPGTNTADLSVPHAASQWIPLVDGSEPPNLVSDGAGHLILVAYP